jgi:hypothetical protein
MASRRDQSPRILLTAREESEHGVPPSLPIIARYDRGLVPSVITWLQVRDENVTVPLSDQRQTPAVRLSANAATAIRLGQRNE